MEITMEIRQDELLCRLCANKNDKAIGIYSEEGIANDLANKMNTYLPVKVSESDALPLHCCWSCASTVLAWHELVVASIEADKKLRGLDVDADADKSVEDVVVDIDAIAEETITADDESVMGSESDTSAASLTAYNDTITTESESQPPSPPKPRAITKTKRKKTETVERKKQFIDDYVDDILESTVVKEEDATGEQQVEEENDGKNVEEWLIKNEDGFTFETEIITDLKEDEGEKKVVVQKKRKKEKKRPSKIDQEKVKAAKMVVDGRVYYHCKICGKSLHSPYTYIWHMRIHTGERPFVCDLCGKQFRVSQGLARHLKETHEGIKNFDCDICGRMFATRRNVVEHRRIHTNERPYICDLCGKAFKQKASLFVHSRSHSDTFPFKCSYCDQGFRTKGPLMIHITRHTGEKPYPCDICGRCFRIKYELKRHRLIHSDEKPFVCMDCGLTFRQKRYLRNHSRITHGILS